MVIQLMIRTMKTVTSFLNVHYSKIFKCDSHRIIESQNHSMFGLGKDLKDHLVPTLLPWAGTSSTRPGCSELHSAWPWTLPC